MKRILTATALATLMATGAHALTAAEEATIERFVPGANMAILDDAEVAQLVAIANSGDSISEKEAKMRAIITGDSMVDYSLSEGQLVKLMRVAPEIDVMAMTDAEKAQAIAIVNSAESRSDAIAKLRAFAESSNPTMSMLTEAEIVTLQRYAPTLDLAMLTEQEVLRLKTAINSGDASDITAVVNNISG